MKLRLIPAGEFTMGTPEDEKGRVEEEVPHRVRISRPFYIGIFEVTQEEFENVMGVNPSWFSAQGEGANHVVKPEAKRHPVEQVDWNDAVEFCRRLSEKEGSTYRLPTEAEWEYACRAGTTTPFHFGTEFNGAQSNTNGKYPYRMETKGPQIGSTVPVGEYSANPFGLYDMHGNVYEWCSDWSERDYYRRSPVVDPEARTEGLYHVIRGGSWFSYPVNCRSGFRNIGTPDYRRNDLGFRVVRVLAQDH
jgi:formylglycine-generating enzyme required for sulfatase activity